MKAKTIVTGLNRKQLRKLALQLQTELGEQQRAVKTIANTNIAITKEHAALKEAKDELEGKNVIAKIILEARNDTIMMLKAKIDELEIENKQLKAESKKPFWKKVFRC